MLDGRLVLCVLLALASALAFAVATVAQQRAAARSSDDEARGWRFVGQLLRRPQWWAGTMGNAGGYVLQGLALAAGPLLLVAPILVTSLLFALPLGARLARRRMTPSAWRWGLILVASLAVFVSLGNPDQGADHAPAMGWLIVSVIGLPIVVACLVLAHPRSGTTRAYLLAVATGVLAGGLAVLTKAVVATIPLGVEHLVTSGETYGLIVVGLSGTYVQQLAFQSGALQASLPVISVLEPMVGAGLGVTLLHEHLEASGLRVAVLAIAVVVMTLATIGLARSEGRLLPEPAATLEGKPPPD